MSSTLHRRPAGILPVLAVAVVIAAIAGTAAAQDSHYWDNQYGTRAELLGGLVVGASTDLSATFYNPGWIALRNEPSVLLTTKAAEAYSIKLQDIPANTSGPSNLVVTPSPGYLAGRFTLGGDDGWKLAYSYLQKVKFEYDGFGLVLRNDPAATPPDVFWSASEAYRTTSVSESWYGVSFSRRISDALAIGFSPYVAQRSQSSRTQLSTAALSAAGDPTGGYVVDDYEYWHLRMLLKVGLAAEWGRWSAGAAVTTPSIGLIGDGSVYRNASLYGDYDPDSPGVDAPYLQANRQDGLDTSWRSPFSIACGGAVMLGPTKLHLTAEWFAGQELYSVIEPAPYDVQSEPGLVAGYSMDYATRSLVNVGVGVDHAISPAFSLFTSYRTDRSALPQDVTSELSITTWDLNHVTAGASFQFLSMEFTTGLQYSWGDGPADRFIAVDATRVGDAAETFGRHDIAYRRLKALLGFNLPFAVPGGGN